MELLKSFLMEEGDKTRVEGSDIAYCFERIGWRMLTQPKFHQGHEYSVAGEEGMVEMVCFSFPLVA